MNRNVQRLTDLLVRFAANVQEGQILDIRSGLGKEQLTRAITASAYRQGARSAVRSSRTSSTMLTRLAWDATSSRA